MEVFVSPFPSLNKMVAKLFRIPGSLMEATPVWENEFEDRQFVDRIMNAFHNDNLNLPTPLKTNIFWKRNIRTCCLQYHQSWVFQPIFFGEYRFFACLSSIPLECTIPKFTFFGTSWRKSSLERPLPTGLVEWSRWNFPGIISGRNTWICDSSMPGEKFQTYSDPNAKWWWFTLVKIH